MPRKVDDAENPAARRSELPFLLLPHVPQLRTLVTHHSDCNDNNSPTGLNAIVGVPQT